MDWENKYDFKYSYKGDYGYFPGWATVSGIFVGGENRDGTIAKNMFGTVYVYRCIITNDWNSSETDIIAFYNKRGESEKNFDVQNNDFGWAHLPFSFLAENTVFMIVTAMLKNSIF